MVKVELSDEELNILWSKAMFEAPLGDLIYYYGRLIAEELQKRNEEE